MDLDQVTRAYINMRDARSKLRKEYETQDDMLKDGQKKLETFLLAHLNTNGIDSARTASGTFYKTETLKPSASDWEAFYKFIKDNDAFEALERRIKRDFVKDYMDIHDGQLPPGVSIHREFEVRVRRAD